MLQERNIKNGHPCVAIYVPRMEKAAFALMPSDWFAAIDPSPGSVQPVRTERAGSAVCLRMRDFFELRIGPSGDDGAARVAALEDLARSLHAVRVATQGKIPADGALAGALTAKGYRVVGHPSIVFSLDPLRAAERLSRLRARVRGRTPTIVPAAPHAIASITTAVRDSQLMDDFEIKARLSHDGPGAILAHESAVIHDAQGIAGFILVGRTASPTTRDLKIRWVAERCRQASLVNVALLLDCLDRATEAGVTCAYFAANPDRHADTIALATTLGATRCGETVALARDLA